MKKRYKIFLWTVLVLGVLLGVFIILYSYTGVVDKAILHVLNLATKKGIQIKYSSIEGNLVGSVKLRDVVVSSENFQMKCRSIQLRYSSIDLIDGNIIINSLLLDSPQILLKASDQVTSEPGKEEVKVTPQLVSQALDLSKFPDILIRDFFIKNGNFSVIREDKKLLQIDKIYLEAFGEINAKKVEFKLKYLKGWWKEKNIILEQLSFHLTGNKKRVTLNQLNILVEDTEIFAHGEIELLPKLRFLVFADTSTISFPLLRKVIPNFPYQQGFLRFYVDYIGVPKNFTGQCFLEGKLDSLQLSKVSLKYDFFQKTLILRDIEAFTNFGKIAGAIQAAPEGNNKISLKFSDINLNKPALTQSKTNIDGTLDIKFNTWHISKLSGTGLAHITDMRYGKIHFDTLFLNLDARDGYWDLREGSRLVVQQESRFFVQGDMTREQILNVHLLTDQNVLDTLNNRLGLDLFRGMGSMNVELFGPLKNPNILGTVLLDSLVVQGIRTYGVEGNFQVTEILGERQGFFDLELSGGLISDILITDGVVNLKLQHNTIHIDSTSFYNEDNYVTLKGILDYETDILNIFLYNFALKYQDYQIYATDTLETYYIDDSLFVENFVLNATGDGEIEVRGMLNFAGESGLAVYFKNIQLFPFNQFLRWRYSLEGLSEISILLSGMPDSLYIESILDVENFILANDRIGDLEASFVYDNGRYKIDQFYFARDAQTFFSLKGALILPEDFSDTTKVHVAQDETLRLLMEFANIELSDYPFFKEFNFPVTGKFGGKLNIDGTISDFEGSYQVTGKNIQYRDFEFPSITVDGFVTPKNIAILNSEINFMETIIKARGEKRILWDYKNLSGIFDDQNFSLFIQLQEDSVNFLNLLIPDADILSGKILASIQLGGKITSPELIGGKIDISSGTLYLSKIENPLTDLRVDAKIENKILRINKFEAKLMGEIEKRNLFASITSVILSPFKKILYPTTDVGEVQISGNIDLKELSRPIFNLTLNATQIFVNYFLENTKVLLSAKNIRITGKDTLQVIGDINVHKGEIDLDLKESEKNLLLSTSVREKPPYLQYLLTVSIPGNFYIRSGATFNSFDLMLRGDLRIIQEPKGLLEMNGNLDVPKGKYFQFEEFSIRNGRVEFINPKELPELNLSAEKKKYGYLFQLNVEGNLNNPLKEIRIFDLNSREDVTHLYPETKDQIALLLFGITFEEIGGSAGTVALEKGGEVVNQALISLIEREARRFIGLDEIRVESESGIIDFTNLRLNQPSENSVISLGKYLMPNLYLEYRTQLGSAGPSSLGNAPTPQLGWEAGNLIYLEYRINRNWSVSSFYAKEISNKFKIDVSWRHSF